MNTFDWIELRTPDLEKTAAFYQSLFGWTVVNQETADGTDVWIFDTNHEPRVQNLRRGGMWARPASGVNGIIVYILVDDITTMIERVKELNGKVVSPIIKVGAGQLVLIADPCGNHFGLYEDLPIES